VKRALVLGGGGAVGIAWEEAILAGLLDAGLDARNADLIIGTSAGSVVGTLLRYGRDPRDLYRAIFEPGERPAAARPSPDPEIAREVFVTWSSFERMTAGACAQVGRLALQANPPGEDAFAWTDILGLDGWPEQPLLITAVDCDTGKLAVWDKTSGVPIERAIASSCAVPGLFQPVPVNGSAYMDGGVWSCTSADLAQRIEPDIVLIIAPIGTGGRGIHLLAAKDIAREKGALEAAGAKVRVVMFDDAAREAGGASLMDPAARAPVAEAGYAHGRRLGAELKPLWESGAAPA